jgi:hypothetical protein
MDHGSRVTGGRVKIRNVKIIKGEMRAVKRGGESGDRHDRTASSVSAAETMTTKRGG